MIAKGTHTNLSIRDNLKFQSLEEKAYYQSNKGTFKKKPIIPQMLSQSKLMELLYAGSSKEDKSELISESAYEMGYMHNRDIVPS